MWRFSLTYANKGIDVYVNKEMYNTSENKIYVYESLLEIRDEYLYPDDDYNYSYNLYTIEEFCELKDKEGLSFKDRVFKYLNSGSCNKIWAERFKTNWQEIKVCYDPSGYSCYCYESCSCNKKVYYFYIVRLENDKEYNKRLKEVEKYKIKAKNDKLKEDEKEKKLFEKLSKKYGKK